MSAGAQIPSRHVRHCSERTLMIIDGGVLDGVDATAGGVVDRVNELLEAGLISRESKLLFRYDTNYLRTEALFAPPPVDPETLSSRELLDIATGAAAHKAVSPERARGVLRDRIDEGQW